jgi:tetratricopeptide (TPR) repeat protein
MEVRELPAELLDVETGGKRLREAIAVHAAGDLKRALKLDDELLAVVDGWVHAAAMYEKGRVLEDLGRREEAVWLWREVMRQEVAHIPGDGRELSLALSAQYAVATYELRRDDAREALKLRETLIAQLSDHRLAATHAALAGFAEELVALLIDHKRDEEATSLAMAAIDAVGDSEVFEIRKKVAHTRLMIFGPLGRLGRFEELAAMADAIASGGEPELAMLTDWVQHWRTQAPGPQDGHIVMGLMLEAEILAQTERRDEALVVIQGAITEFADNPAPGMKEIVNQARVLRDEIDPSALTG